MTREDLVVLTGDDDLLFADGFDDAIVGVIDRCGQPSVVTYDRDKCISILVEREKMSVEEAQEYFDVNVVGAWVGDRTPAFLSKP